MRTTPRPPISTHRLARFEAWLRLWLVWFVGWCAAWWAGGERAHPRRLDRVARGVAALVVGRAVRRLDFHAFALKRARHRHGRIAPVLRRTLMGARLRRALRARNFPDRLAAIVAVVRDLDAHVARLTRRLRGGLSRLRVIDPVPECAPAIRCVTPCAVGVNDSS